MKDNGGKLVDQSVAEQRASNAVERSRQDSQMNPWNYIHYTLVRPFLESRQ